jgi:hypothetical protein
LQKFSDVGGVLPAHLLSNLLQAPQPSGCASVSFRLVSCAGRRVRRHHGQDRLTSVYDHHSLSSHCDLSEQLQEPHPGFADRKLDAVRSLVAGWGCHASSMTGAYDIYRR